MSRPNARHRRDVLAHVVSANTTGKRVASILRREGWRFYLGGAEAAQAVMSSPMRLNLKMPPKVELSRSDWAQIADHADVVIAGWVHVRNRARALADGREVQP